MIALWWFGAGVLAMLGLVFVGLWLLKRSFERGGWYSV